MNFLSISEIKFSNRVAFLLIVLAYIFSIWFRYYYFAWASGVDLFVWNGTLMINNVDGYYYAAGAKEILNNSHVVGNLNPYNSFLSILTAYIVKFLPFSLDEVILWMPAVFGSLVVIPLFLIGRSLKNDILGFCAALIGGIVWSYYNRTMVGYYDTDLLIIVFLVFVVWSIVEYLANKNEKMILASLFFIILYQLWYPGSKNVLLAIVGMTFFYSLLKKEKENFIFVLFLIIPLLGFNLYIKLLLIGLLYAFYIKKRDYFLESKNLIIMYIGMFLLLILSGSLNSMISAFFTYFNRNSAVEQNTLHFFNVVKTVREAGAIPYDLVAKRVSGNVLLFIFSAIGYILMLIRFPVMIVTLPSVVIGLLAYKLGLRFTIYAVPFFALGFAYLAVLISEYLSKLFIDDKISKYTKIVLPLILILPSLYLNRLHAIDYKTPTTFIKQEVESLVKLSKIATPQDYVLTWWDYGYPIRYYANVKTLIDGGKHSGEVNFPVSFALTQNQIKAANIARLDVEYTDKIEVTNELGKNLPTKGFIEDMMKKYGFKNPNEFLKALGDKNFTLPNKTRDVYFYFPFRMTNIYPIVALFSSIDLATGKVNQPFIIPTSVANVNNTLIQFSNGMILDLKRGALIINKTKVISINRFYISFYDKNGKFRVKKLQLNPISNFNIVWYRSLNKVLIVSNSYFNSTYVQMFFLENYDKELFEPVVLNPFVKIYKLKK